MLGSALAGGTTNSQFLPVRPVRRVPHQSRAAGLRAPASAEGIDRAAAGVSRGQDADDREGPGHSMLLLTVSSRPEKNEPLHSCRTYSEPGFSGDRFAGVRLLTVVTHCGRSVTTGLGQATGQ